MKKANLPVEKAIEPHEGAHQPLVQQKNVTPKFMGQPSIKKITFAEDADNEPSSQMSSSYKDVLSQPAPGLTHREKLEWLQKRRRPGLWVNCDECKLWRELPDVLDRYELPEQWFCRMNPDLAYADCSVPEVQKRVCDEEDLIHSEYSAGSVVWARMAGWPWWPAIVDDCPDTEQYYWLDGFSDIPTHYNVVFFDSGDVTRAWIAPEKLKPYAAYKDSFISLLQNNKHKTRLRAAVKQADDAIQLPLAQRLKKYSFLTKYRGKIHSPKKISVAELDKQEKNWKRKINIQVQNSESEDEPVQKRKNKARPNAIILGTPKKLRPRAAITSIDRDELGAVSELAEETPAPKAIDDLDATVSEIAKETTAKNTEEFELLAEIIKTETEPKTMSCYTKNASSLAVQVGSTADSEMVEETFDDDTSKTYVPEKDSEDSKKFTQSTETFPREYTVQIKSPSSIHSDDFEY